MGAALTLPPPPPPPSRRPPPSPPLCRYYEARATRCVRERHEFTKPCCYSTSTCSNVLGLAHAELCWNVLPRRSLALPPSSALDPDKSRPPASLLPHSIWNIWSSDMLIISILLAATCTSEVSARPLLSRRRPSRGVSKEPGVRRRLKSYTKDCSDQEFVRHVWGCTPRLPPHECPPHECPHCAASLLRRLRVAHVVSLTQSLRPPSPHIPQHMYSSLNTRTQCHPTVRGLN